MHHLYVLVTCSIYVVAAYGLPLTVVNTLDGEEVSDDDDFTTHTLERLSSAATCLVAGVEYTHGQQIYRTDQCEFCLCLDGEMFCWWQDCPPTLEGPCKDKNPFSPCLNGARSHTESTQLKISSFGTSKAVQILNETTTSASTSENFSSTDRSADIMSSVETTTKKIAPKVCIVMGREYKLGDRLPHDTGNCVECVCGTGGQVTCSPHQCAPLGDDISDYRPPGPRPPLSDAF